MSGSSRARSLRAAGRMSRPPSFVVADASISARRPSRIDRIEPSSVFERDVAGEPVGDDDVGGAVEDVAALGVAPEVEIGGREQRVRLERELVALLRLLADREETDASARATPRISSAKTAPIVAELEQVLGAAVGVRADVDRGPTARRACGIGTAIAGRRTPGKRRITTRPAASIAPVFPGETTASASPSATALTARTSELSSFVRSTSAGFSSIPTTCVVSTSSSPRVSRSAAPKMTGSMPSARAASAPSTTASGPTISSHRIDSNPAHGRRRYGACV